MQPNRVVRSSEDETRPALKSARADVVNIRSGGNGAMIWRGPEYPLLEPGRYTVRGTKLQGPEWVRSFNRWSLRIEFALTTEPGSVSAFFNLGNDKTAKHFGRQSRYFRAWTIANGGMPFRGQDMTPDVFLEGQFFEVEVEQCDTDSKGNPKNEAEVYSRITGILRAWTP